MTKGYNLPAQWVIHTVGPIWHGGKQHEPELLASCYQNVLRIAEEKAMKTIAFPAISCGVYGYPLDQACLIAMKEVTSFLDKHSTPEKVIFACFNKQVEDNLREAQGKI